MLYQEMRAALIAAGCLLGTLTMAGGCASAPGKPTPAPVHGFDVNDLSEGVYRVSSHTVDGRVYDIHEYDLPSFFEGEARYNVVRDGELLFNTSIENPPFSEITDGVTGEQLFPITRGEIVYIPGEGFLHNPRTVDRREQYLTHKPAREFRLTGAFEPMDWRKVNFETRKLERTNIAEIRGYEAVEPAKTEPAEMTPDTVITAQQDGPIYARRAIVRRIPVQGGGYHETAFELTLRDHTGRATAVIPNAITLPMPAGPHPSLGYLDDDGNFRVAILSHEYQPQSVTPPGTRYFDVATGNENAAVKVVLATPAPESTEELPLYLVFDDRGEFSTPPGVAGFRPIEQNRDARRPLRKIDATPVSYWLVRYAEDETQSAEDQRYKWGLANAPLTDRTVAIFEEAVVLDVEDVDPDRRPDQNSRPHNYFKQAASLVALRQPGSASWGGYDASLEFVNTPDEIRLRNRKFQGERVMDLVVLHQQAQREHQRQADLKSLDAMVQANDLGQVAFYGRRAGGKELYDLIRQRSSVSERMYATARDVLKDNGFPAESQAFARQANQLRDERLRQEALARARREAAERARREAEAQRQATLAAARARERSYRRSVYTYKPSNTNSYISNTWTPSAAQQQQRNWETQYKANMRTTMGNYAWQPLRYE